MLNMRHGTSRFFNDIIKVAGSNIVSRLIFFLGIPLVTFFYDPKELQVYSVYQSILTTLLTVCCLRLEVAIPLAKNDKDAANLSLCAIFFTVSVSICAYLVTLLAGKELLSSLRIESLHQYLYLLPTGLLIGGIGNNFQYIITRAKRFNFLATIRIMQSLSTIICMLIIGSLYQGPSGLLLGSVIGLMAGLSFTFKTGYIFVKKCIKTDEIIDCLKRHLNYILFVAPSALINHLGNTVPVIVVSSAVGVEAGFFFLGLSLMTTPVTVIGQAVGQSLIAHLIDQDRKGTLLETLQKLIRNLIYLGCFPIALIGVSAPLWIPLALDVKYLAVARVLQILWPSAALAMLSYPLSVLLLHAEKTKELMVVRSCNATLKIGTSVCCSFISPNNIILVFGLISVITELACLVSFYGYKSEYRFILVSVTLKHFLITGALLVTFVTLFFCFS